MKWKLSEKCCLEILGQFSLALSKGPKTVYFSLSSPEDGNRSSLRHVVFSSYESLEVQRWTTFRNPAILNV
jgi:hypothetical protein